MREKLEFNERGHERNILGITAMTEKTIFARRDTPSGYMQQNSTQRIYTGPVPTHSHTPVSTGHFVLVLPQAQLVHHRCHDALDLG